MINGENPSTVNAADKGIYVHEAPSKKHKAELERLAEIRRIVREEMDKNTREEPK